MTTPLTALSASPQHEPVLPALQARKNDAAMGNLDAVEVLTGVAKPSATEKRDALDEINKSLELASIGVRFEFDEEANKMITKVVDVETGEMIRQMPSEEVVRMAKAMNSLTGLLLSQSV